MTRMGELGLPSPVVFLHSSIPELLLLKVFLMSLAVLCTQVVAEVGLQVQDVHA